MALALTAAQSGVSRVIAVLALRGAFEPKIEVQKGTKWTQSKIPVLALKSRRNEVELHLQHKAGMPVPDSLDNIP